MPLSETIAVLANAIGNAREPLTSWERLLVNRLNAMPLYRDSGRLDVWQGTFSDAWDSRPPTEPAPTFFSTAKLLDNVYELACINLYSSFSPPIGQCKSLVRDLGVHHGIEINGDLDVSDW
jgi:hypothetical protein